MNTVLRKILAAFGVLTVALSLTCIAGAQCANLDINQLKAGLLQKQSFEGFNFGDAKLKAAGDDIDPIVGFWKVSLDIGTNNIDSAFVQWHADGTEIMNSKRPPVTSSFCLGVWKRVAPSKYALNHYAITWNPDNTMVGVTNIRESITLANDGDHYSGTFTITQYDEAGNDLGGPSGTVTGFRIKVNTVITHL